MWLGFFSPLRHILGGTHIINDLQGKALRQTFWQKLKATYEVFAGRSASELADPRAHVGVLEYPTLLIGRAIEQLLLGLQYLVNHKDKAYWLIYAPVLLVCILPRLVLNITISLAAIAITLLILPIVLIVHLLTKTKGEKLRKDALFTEITVSKANNGLKADENSNTENSNTVKTIMQGRLFHLVDTHMQSLVEPASTNAKEMDEKAAVAAVNSIPATIGTEKMKKMDKKDFEVSLEDLSSTKSVQKAQNVVTISYWFSMYEAFRRNQTYIYMRSRFPKNKPLVVTNKTSTVIQITLDITQTGDRLVFDSLVGLNVGGLKNYCQDNNIDPAQLVAVPGAG